MTSLVCLLLQKPSKYGKVGVYMSDADRFVSSKYMDGCFPTQGEAEFIEIAEIEIIIEIWRHEKCRTDSLQSVCYQRLLTLPHSFRNECAPFLPAAN